MPFCPSCGEEFRSDVLRCQDCDRDLVPGRPHGVDAAMAYTDLVKVVNVGNLSQARIVVAALIDNDVQATIKNEIVDTAVNLDADPSMLSGFDVMVPRELEARAREVLADLDIAYSPTPEEIAEWDGEVAVAGDVADAALLLGKLMEVRQALREAVLRRAAIRPDGQAILFRLVERAVSNGDVEAVTAVAPALSGADRAAAEALANQHSESPKRDVRVALAAALAAFDTPAAWKVLVSLLEDHDSTVREEAIESLFSLTGETFEFEPDGPEEDRKIAIGRWYSRLKDRSRRLRTPE